MKYRILLAFFLIIAGCQSATEILKAQTIQPGAMQIDSYLPKIEGKRIGVVVNPTSRVGDKHLLDTLLALEQQVVKVFTPEHGLRGDKSAGEIIADGIDQTTGIPVVSLYGSNKKPREEHLKDLDVVIFDMQDVGTRFYTYISTMHYMMEACATYDVPLIILDRPNPNGHYIAGPVREKEFKSFVGMHPIPIVHGLTVGELAHMIIGEKWLDTESELDLTVIPIKNWDHENRYELPVKPSPNLPNTQAIQLYPSLCLFEGTVVSVGRGTAKPFQIIGHPDYPVQQYSFVPKSMSSAKYPPFEDEKCFGVDLSSLDPVPQFTLRYLIQFYNALKEKDDFFNNYFNTLAGNASLQEQIKTGTSEEDILSSWQPDLTLFKAKRKKYLLYKDFD